MGSLLPARAGMDPVSACACSVSAPAPRACGDGPGLFTAVTSN